MRNNVAQVEHTASPRRLWAKDGSSTSNKGCQLEDWLRKNVLWCVELQLRTCGEVTRETCNEIERAVENNDSGKMNYGLRQLGVRLLGGDMLNGTSITTPEARNTSFATEENPTTHPMSLVLSCSPTFSPMKLSPKRRATKSSGER